MGSFFSNILVENTATKDAMKTYITQALDALGFIPADEDDAVDCAIRVYGSDDDRFWVVVGDAIEDKCVDLAQGIAKAGKCCTIAVECVDSDVLMLSLTKGRALSTVCMGIPEAYDIEPEPFRAAAWKELIGKKYWTGFLWEIKEDHALVEEALEPLAKMIGFNHEHAVRLYDDPGEPLFECAFRRKVVVPLYFPDDQPPSFKWNSWSGLAQNPLWATFYPSGGRGMGFYLLIAANKFDANACEIKHILIR